MTIAEFKKRTLIATVKAMGRLTTKEHGDSRVDCCNACKYAGVVKPLKDKDLEMPGCVICGCPFATKPYMISIFGNKIECPHPDGNRWAEIDKQFQNH